MHLYWHFSVFSLHYFEFFHHCRFRQQCHSCKGTIVYFQSTKWLTGQQLCCWKTDGRLVVMSRFQSGSQSLICSFIQQLHRWVVWSKPILSRTSVRLRPRAYRGKQVISVFMHVSVHKRMHTCVQKKITQLHSRTWSLKITPILLQFKVFTTGKQQRIIFTETWQRLEEHLDWISMALATARCLNAAIKGLLMLQVLHKVPKTLSSSKANPLGFPVVGFALPHLTPFHNSDTVGSPTRWLVVSPEWNDLWPLINKPQAWITSGVWAQSGLRTRLVWRAWLTNECIKLLPRDILTSAWRGHTHTQSVHFRERCTYFHHFNFVNHCCQLKKNVNLRSPFHCKVVWVSWKAV